MFRVKEIEDGVREEFRILGMSEDLQGRTTVRHVYNKDEPQTLQITAEAAYDTHYDRVSVTVQFQYGVLMWSEAYIRVAKNGNHLLFVDHTFDCALHPRPKAGVLVSRAGDVIGYRLMKVNKE